MKTDIERQMRFIGVKGGEKTIISFDEHIIVEPEVEGDASQVKVNNYTVKSPEKPHENLTKALTKLRKYALKSVEIAVDNKSLPDWSVLAIKITGDIVLRQSRVEIILGKRVNRTGKIVPFPIPQLTMYGESEFVDAEEMTKAIEDVIAEGFAFIDGDYFKETGQLPLFSNIGDRKSQMEVLELV